MSRRKRYLAITLAVLAIAVPATAAAALPGEASPVQRVAAGVGFLAHTRKIPDDCVYPPHSAPTVTLSTNRSSAKKNQEIKLTAVVTYNDCGLKNWRVVLYKSPTATGTYTKVSRKTTNSRGIRTFEDVKIKETTYFKVVTESAAGLGPGTSNTITVTFVP
ncbi:hypothetical protein [Kineosporia sp. R_H_3]|uniref:hypothetical protein n=1 Tax=Kineosporia sp. R_H_3 TaxID=1961848 RepID=UPI00117BCA19|nr:hypothetical protein [Kineosporia sp. R_H_3]